MIKLDKIYYYYENLTINLSLNLNKGERLVILGPNGAGKSTIFYLIAGFRYLHHGKIFLNQQDHTYTIPAKRPVSMLFQANNLFLHLTVWQNIALGISPNLNLDKTQQSAIQQIAEQFSINNCLSCLPSQISGGQRQRTVLARCLLRKKPILLLDEPFSGCDPVIRNEILILLKQICEERKLTLLMISHNLEDALIIASRAIVIAKGKITYDGELDYLIDGLIPVSKLFGISSNRH